MKLLSRAACSIFALITLAGCSSTHVNSRQAYTGTAKVARPDRIIVYDFGATPSDIPRESPLASQATGDGQQQTPQQIELGRKLGMEVASELVAEIKTMGLPAVRAEGQPPPRVGDLVIRGYFVSVSEGSAGKRVLVGFGSGSAELKTAVEGYLMTNQGLRRVGGGEMESGGSKTPGALVGVATLAATGNPIGLIVSGASKLAGEAKGSSTVDGRATETAHAIAEEMRTAFKKQGWI
ncbi:DUF4410 domain-containing protein [Methylococcus mesophilus]|uniref:DUF4410 domain-containing protein n=1 Tax=Methylococcus mesophilus TaxID=2993564 RepID=UPI00224B2FF4|nr:DUF4410 domain-containing protein [Methylococcus mesophilus]UZR27739.1 DUF4410 domain-containing protein [Methylococcus mesophilus]